jgi:hypothetical protein
MYQSSTRNNFLDTLLDPKAIAILGSIALHATIGASLPLLTQPEKEAKKADPGTVKVVELTPNELQRIPQVPQSPKPQALPPAAKPIAPSRQATATRTPQFSTNPQTIPFSPIRIPLNSKTFKPPSVTKEQQVIPQKQPTAPIFDPDIFKNPAPKFSPLPVQKGIIPKQAAQPSPSPKPQPITKAPKTPDLQLPKDSDDDGGGQTPLTPAPTPTTTAQQPAPSPSSPSPVPTNSPGNNNGSGGDYGAYAQAALAKLQEYQTKYPNIKLYPSKSLQRAYTPLKGTSCPKVKQRPFIVLMVAFDKVPVGEDPITGGAISPTIENEKPYLNGDPATLANKKLIEQAATEGLADATATDKNRPEADKGKPVLYQYRVQMECKQ